MSAHCCEHDTPAPQTVIDLPRYRRVLWVALVVNAAMFAIEIIGGIPVSYTHLDVYKRQASHKTQAVVVPVFMKTPAAWTARTQLSTQSISSCGKASMTSTARCWRWTIWGLSPTHAFAGIWRCLPR